MMSQAVQDFRRSTGNLLLWIDVIDHVNYLASKNVPSGKERVLVGARRVQKSAKALGVSLNVVPFEGAYLFVCAEYELAVRRLIEDFSSAIHQRVRRFDDLPEKLRARHISNAAQIITDRKKDQFQSLSIPDIVAKLNKCLDPNTPDHGFELCGEALSYSTNNFRWETIKDVVTDLGISDLGNRVGNDRAMRRALKVPTSGHVAQMWPRELNNIMLTRNRIIHRSNAFTSPTGADIRQIVARLTAFLATLERILKAHYQDL